MALAATTQDSGAALLAAWPAPEGEAAWMRQARDKARTRLLAMGAPGRRDEYWKYTDPTRLLDDTAPATTLAAEDVTEFEGFDALTLVFVDGLFRPEKSDDPAMEGVEITALADAAALDIHWAQDVFGVLEDAGQSPVPRPLAALNTVAARSGFAIRATGKAARPIKLLYLQEDAGASAMVRNVIRVDPGAELTVLEAGPAAPRLNQCMEVDVADNGVFHHVRVQGRSHDRLAATHLFLKLGQESTAKSFTLTMNGRLTRNEAVIEFTGDDAVAHVAGACVGEGDFHHDDTVFVTHDALRCESRQVFKKVLKGGARGVFQGKILVREGAQKTDGYQISQALLLDEQSEFDAKPELEIYADDVVCSHGSTCGAADETALFYLRSRGVPKAEAENLLVIAFLAEALDEVDETDIAEHLRERIAGWLSRRAGT